MIVGGFYGGRDHWTVCHGIYRIEALRETDPDVDALICELRRQLVGNHNQVSDGEGKNKNLNPISTPNLNVDELADLVAKRVCAYLEKRLQHPS